MNKRLVLAKILSSLGVGFFSRLINNDTLFIFNYHRIKKNTPDEGLFDDGVYGPDILSFEKQMLYLKKHCTIVGEAEIINMVNGCNYSKGPFAAVTFDDAYKDNYNLALPVLKQFKIPALFFIPVGMIESRVLGWWDQAAYIIKNTSKKKVVIKNNEIFLCHKDSALQSVLNMFKTLPSYETAALIEELSHAANFPTPNIDEMSQELMTWDEIIKSQRAGVTIGSHTYSHKVLTTLTNDQQAWELLHSKKILEERLGLPIRSLAYPVGGLEHFNATTLALAEKAKYQLAFSFNTGVEKFNNLHRYNIPRYGGPSTFDLFKEVVNYPRLFDYGYQSRKIYKAKQCANIISKNITE